MRIFLFLLILITMSSASVTLNFYDPAFSRIEGEETIDMIVETTGSFAFTTDTTVIISAVSTESWQAGDFSISYSNNFEDYQIDYDANFNTKFDIQHNHFEDKRRLYFWFSAKDINEDFTDGEIELFEIKFIIEKAENKVILKMEFK